MPLNREVVKLPPRPQAGFKVADAWPSVNRRHPWRQDDSRIRFEGDGMAEVHDIGEKPGKGRYCCTNCDWSVKLDDADDRLPPCGSCGRMAGSAGTEINGQSENRRAKQMVESQG